MAESAGARSGCPVSVRTRRPCADRRGGDGPPRVAEGPGDDVEPGVIVQPVPRGFRSGQAHVCSFLWAGPVRCLRTGRTLLSTRPATCPARANRLECRLAIAVEVAEHLETEVEGDHGVGDVTGGDDRADRRPRRGHSAMADRANSRHEWIRSATSAPRPGTDDAPAIISTRTVMCPASRSVRKTSRGHVDQLAQRADPTDRFSVLLESLGTHVVEGGQQEVGHRAEVVEDQPLVGPGPPGDGPGAGPDEAVLLQRLDRGIDELAAGAGRTGPAPFRHVAGSSGLRHAPPPPAYLSKCSKYMLKRSAPPMCRHWPDNAAGRRRAARPRDGPEPRPRRLARAPERPGSSLSACPTT